MICISMLDGHGVFEKLPFSAIAYQAPGEGRCDELMRAASVPKETTQTAVEATEPMRNLRQERRGQSSATRSTICGLGADVGGDRWGGLRSSTLNIVHPVGSWETAGCTLLLEWWRSNLWLSRRHLLLHWWRLSLALIGWLSQRRFIWQGTHARVAVAIVAGGVPA